MISDYIYYDHATKLFKVEMGFKGQRMGYDAIKDELAYI